MIDWLRPLLMMFYAPSRAMGEVRDRAPLAPALLMAFIAQALYLMFTEWLYRRTGLGARPVLSVLFSSLSLSFSSVLFVALVFVPVTAIAANLFERRGSIRLVMQQEYAPLASTVFYGWTAAHLLAIPLAFLTTNRGWLNSHLNSIPEMSRQFRESFNPSPEQLAVFLDLHLQARIFFWFIMLPFFWLWAAAAVRKVFRLSWPRTLLVMVISSIVVYLSSIVLIPLFGWVFASPFLLLLLFLFVRGYLGDVMSGQRARTSFKKNLEVATLNPADASAHYNLGLIHQQRGELEAARARFERAVEIDAEELDAHYQLGRIARQENRLPDAIKHFEEVVSRDQTHAQHEIWREIGASYLAAGQFADARDALERFLDERQLDPEGLYLMGRAHAGLGHQREAAASMEACIEAVKTAPAYKYRTEKRWLNEAQQYIKSSR